MSYASEEQLTRGYLMGYLTKDGEVTQNKDEGIKEILIYGIHWIEHGLAETCDLGVTIQDITIENVK